MQKDDKFFVSLIAAALAWAITNTLWPIAAWPMAITIFALYYLPDEKK